MKTLLSVGIIGLLSGSLAYGVNVAAATGNSTTDTANIVSAIAACPAAGSVVWGSGTWQISHSIALKNNCTYTSSSGAILSGFSGTGSGGYAIFNTASQDASFITINGLTFNGGGMQIGNLAGASTGVVHYSTNINITSNTIHNIDTSSLDYTATHGIYFNGCKNCNITNNTFAEILWGGDDSTSIYTPTHWAEAIGLFFAVNTDIAFNTFDHIHHAIKQYQSNTGGGGTPPVNPDAGSGGKFDKFRIYNNTFTRIHGMATELQGGHMDHFLYANNWIHQGVKSNATMGFSFAAGWGSGTGGNINATNAEIRNNMFDHRDSDNISNASECIESWGTATLVDHNVCASSTTNNTRWTYFVAIGGPNQTISNNTICGSFVGPVYVSDGAYSGAPNVGTGAPGIIFTANSVLANCTGVTNPPNFSIGNTAPTITTVSPLPGGTIGVPYSQTLIASGTTPITWDTTSGTICGGLSLSASGLISGTPTTAQTCTVTYRATNATGNNTLPISITVVAASPVITSATSDSVNVNVAYSYTITANNTPTSWTAALHVVGGLPAGLSLTTNVLSGTPTASGIYTIDLTATNASGTGTATLTLTVVSGTAPAPASGLFAQNGGDLSVNLSWVDNSSTETGFKVMRRFTQTSDPFSLVTIVGANVTSYNDPALNDLYQYDYEIIATNGGTNDAAPSNVVTIQVLRAFPLVPWTDNFNTGQLNNIWAFVNPVGDGTYSVPGSTLQLTVPAAAAHDPSFGGVNSSVRMVQAISNLDFTVTTEFDSLPTLNLQLEGVLVEQDSTNYIRNEILSVGSGLIASVAKIVGGVQTSISSNSISVGVSTSIWMRIVHAGNVWTMSWSPDGVNFTQNASFTQALTASKIGPYAGNFQSPATSSPAFTAVINNFGGVTAALFPATTLRVFVLQ